MRLWDLLSRDLDQFIVKFGALNLLIWTGKKMFFIFNEEKKYNKLLSLAKAIPDPKNGTDEAIHSITLYKDAAKFYDPWKFIFYQDEIMHLNGLVTSLEFYCQRQSDIKLDEYIQKIKTL